MTSDSYFAPKRHVILLAGLAFLLNFISIFVPWSTYSANYLPIPNAGISGYDYSGGIHLSYTVSCTAIQGTPQPDQSKKTCATIQLADLPRAVSDIAPAMIVGLTFTILAILSSSFNVYFVYKTASCNSAFLTRAHISNGITILSNLLAFSVYAGVLNSNFSLGIEGVLLGFQGINQSFGFGAGFGLCITAFLLELLNSFLLYRVKNHLTTSDGSTVVTNPITHYP